jgi:hypothetical protein
MVSKNLKSVMLAFILVFGILIFLGLVNAASCWTYTSEAGGCNSTNGCMYKSDAWGSWCETLSCNGINLQSDCSSLVVAGKNCSWQTGGTTNYCQETSCYSFSGTNSSSCEVNAANKSCSWSTFCVNKGGSATDCTSISTQATCGNTTGCQWGECRDKGCPAYTTNSTCAAGLDFNGNNCTWSSSGNYCKEQSCYDTTVYPNKTVCDAATGISCEWKWGHCEEKGCWSFDFTNASACVNNTVGEACTWSGSYCNTDGCGSAGDQTTCQLKQNCQWATTTSSGWCEQVRCSNYDSWAGGNRSDCEVNTYGIDCAWTGNPYGDNLTGWCFSNSIAGTSCANLTVEKECYDTNYCWWQANNWNDPTLGGNCSEPTWGTGDFSDLTGDILNEFNPGCYLFDQNSTKCNLILGCNNTASGSCDPVDTDQGFLSNYSANITRDGIQCSFINDSNVCNNVARLSTCCVWNNGTCSIDYYSNSCKEDLDETPNGEIACEDAKTKSNCNVIAGDPWYMPCSWSNSTKKCNFKASDIFGNGSQSLVKIENKDLCKAAGGKWITENYCEGSIAVPVGRCEYKFDDEANCDKACFACETKTSNGVTVNATNARDSCVGSRLGYCGYTNDTNAPNGIGYCKAKSEYKTGVAGNCNSVCGDCTHLGDPNSNATRDSSNNCISPSCYCTESAANSAGGGCKWIKDNSTATGGFCLNKGEKTCLDACDRCGTRGTCANNGRSALNSSGSCKWEGSDNDGSCVSNIGGSSEICWDGEDNNNDGLIDCGDPSCYSDSWCGFVTGDCFGWSSNQTCFDNGCEWVNDTWNPSGWCDFKGSQCWKNNNNEASCTGITNVSVELLNITSARIGALNGINESKTFTLSKLGSGWVSGSVTVVNESGSIISAGNFTVDYSTLTINFTNSTFMRTGGGLHNFTNVTYQYYADPVRFNCEWNAGSGAGFCEQDWSVHEVCFTGVNESNCEGLTGCNWKNDTWCASGGSGEGSEWCNGAGGWCDHESFGTNDCWQKFDNSSCSGVTGCTWKADQFSGSRCEVNWSAGTSSLETCWSQSTESTCLAAATGSGGCVWRFGSFCEPSCFGQISESGCNAKSGCLWQAESGWCEEQAAAQCSNSTNAVEAECTSVSECRWNSAGWCDPKDGGFSAGGVAGGGGGAGGGSGAECYKYDGNQTVCTNKTLINITCGWFPEPSPFCEVDWSSDCWQYTTSGTCDSGGCWWNPSGFGGGYCTNLMDQCWENVTLKGNATSCDSNLQCNSTTWGGCEPTCFSASTESTCTATGCKWASGWCNPAGMNKLFDSMESGAPSPLGVDVCDGSETTQQSVDICGFGMKDMGNGYGFGINVRDFSNSSICNKVKISSNVVDSFGGSLGSGGSERVGDGNDSVTFIVYLDTDGSDLGGCRIDFNTSRVGYEFRLKYSSIWNASKEKAVETFNSYKCQNSKWEASDIKISAWKKLMCSEIGGAMVAIEKSELSRFPTLYDSSADLRVSVATIGNTGNITTPSDSTGPGYITPGTIDFPIVGCFDYGIDSGKFEDILRNGFVQGEDCFSAADDDNDGTVNCDDWDCQFSSQCANIGVNSAGYNDTQTPKVTGVRIEEYTDSFLVMYDTNKPANGTLEFYRNDSRCLSINATVNDVGISSNNVRDYRLSHKGEVYSNTIGYSLTNSTTYYYKLRVCDDQAKCGVSQCTSITTANTGKCGFCDFVTRIKVPSGWYVSYDTDQNGIYEHAQGLVCGANAGMKTNYTIGRSVNIIMNKSDGSVYFEFMNASLTKSGLNDKVRSISTTGDVIGNSNVVGLTSNTRDKIINSLNPEVCRVKIPVTDGSCGALFHCDDNGENCTDRTADATLLDAVNCVWQVPNCEFSTYRESESTTTSSSPSSSSGGGGGGASSTSTSNESEEIDDVVDSKDSGAIGDQEGEVEKRDQEAGGAPSESGESRGLGAIFWIVIGIVVIVGIVGIVVGLQKTLKKKRGY